MLWPVIVRLCFALLITTTGVRADDAGCYTSGSVAGIVIATVVVTLVMGGLAAAFIWYLWKQRKGYSDNKSVEKSIICPPMSPDKQLISQQSNDYAFDNPYFKDDETDNATPDAAEKGEAGFRTDNGDVTSSQNNKASNGIPSQPKKNNPFSSLRFHAVFHPSGKKQQRATMDDTYISKHLERITVPLRGHDFTGLGFNVCGNMRDGIFVKDVLHRGPASESGKIKAGDRIVSLTVSFCSMVYEDALTIISYASPYDVWVEIEKAPVTSTGEPHLPPSSPKRIGTSTSFRSDGHKTLFHPLYRSQSIVDLTQIGKDGFGVMNTSTDSQRESNSSATPKRSQSVEAANGGLKTRPAFIMKSDESKSASNKGSRKSSTSSSGSAGKDTEKMQKATNQKPPATKAEAVSARFRPEEPAVKTESIQKNAAPAKPARELDVKPMQNGGFEKNAEPTSVVRPSESATKSQESSAETSGSSEAEQDQEKPTAPPRKTSTPKRKAPAPPPAPPPRTETSAVVHRVDDIPPETSIKEPEIPKSENETSQVPPPPPPTTELPLVEDSQIRTVEEHSEKILSVFNQKETDLEPDLGSSDNSVASAENLVTKPDKEDQSSSSPGKRKASSLGDLTKLQNGAESKTSNTSAILERAVSLDLQQSLPGENLVKQKTLRAPTFEKDFAEDKEDSVDVGSPGLKRWNDGLDKVFTSPGEVEKVTEESNNDVKCLTQTKTESDEEKIKENETDIDIEIKESKTVEISNKTETICHLDIESREETESKEKDTAANLNDTFIEEVTLKNFQDSPTPLTSTPVKRIIEIKNISKDSGNDENREAERASFPALENNENKDEPSVKHTVKSTSLFSPVTISIPVIKPDLTHYEKLSSPPSTTYTSHETVWKNLSKNPSSDENKTSLERISIQSLYKPIFSTKEVASADEPDADTSAKKLVNGNESDESEHYSTAQENISTSSVENSSYTVTLTTPVITETPKIPTTIAGFAKTLIIPGPNEVENLLSLANEPNTPPPKLDPPVKPMENE